MITANAGFTGEGVHKNVGTSVLVGKVVMRIVNIAYHSVFAERENFLFNMLKFSFRL